ncbi:hypothetical protein [Natranaerobius trueperi]|nr:hypothetical protein [Natranaerobius trueperi]
MIGIVSVVLLVMTVGTVAFAQVDNSSEELNFKEMFPFMRSSSKYVR